MTENLEWRDPQAGDVWSATEIERLKGVLTTEFEKDGEPTVMHVYNGHTWLPAQQSLRTDGDGKEEKD